MISGVDHFASGCDAFVRTSAARVIYSRICSSPGVYGFSFLSLVAREPSLLPALIRLLHLKALPKESGYLGLIGRSAQSMAVGHRSLAVQSQVYYMLTRDRPVNYLHWLASDDTHILIEGGPVDYFIFHPDGTLEEITLGRDVTRGEHPVVAVPGGCWKALRLHSGVSFALMANVLSPEFTPDRVGIGEGPDWIRRYKGAARWATEENLRALIGPNWIPGK